MRPGQRPSADSSVSPQNINVPSLDDRRDLHVAQLPNVNIATIFPSRPAQEEAAGRLHEVLACDEALTVIPVKAFARVRFKHRRVRLLDLEEQRVVVGRHEESHQAHRADTAYSDHLDRQVAKPEAISTRVCSGSEAR